MTQPKPERCDEDDPAPVADWCRENPWPLVAIVALVCVTLLLTDLIQFGLTP